MSIEFLEDSDLTIQCTVKEGGAAKDITGASAITWILTQSAGGPAVLTKALGSGVAIADGAAGRFDVTLSRADTAGLRGTYEQYARVEVGGASVPGLGTPIKFNQSPV